MRIEAAGDGSGRRLLEKRAETSDEASRLRREADLLEVAAHPGLVEPIRFQDGAEPCLQTGFLEGGALSDTPGLEVEEVAGVVAALVSTIADLHAMNLVHGAVAAEHVVLDEDGRPVLCSLGYGGLAGERPSALPALPPPYADPARVEGAPLDGSTDVFGAGVILRELVGNVSGHPRRATLEALGRLAERATATDPGVRPTARNLADAVHDAVLGARLPRRGSAGAPPGPVPAAAGGPAGFGARQGPLERWRLGHVPPARSRSLRPVLLPVAVLAVATAGLFAFTRARPVDQRSPSLSAHPAPPVSATTEPLAEGDAVVTKERAAATLGGPGDGGPRSGCPRLEAVLSADVDGDGCAEEVSFTGGVLRGGALRWDVGQEGDLVAVGDWSCGGVHTLALLRPATGEVFAFDGWATAERETHAPVVGRIAGGRTLRPADLDADGCHELVVERATGAPVVLRMTTGGQP